jgi:hypothetical protein
MPHHVIYNTKQITVAPCVRVDKAPDPQRNLMTVHNLLKKKPGRKKRRGRSAEEAPRSRRSQSVDLFDWTSCAQT